MQAIPSMTLAVSESQKMRGLFFHAFAPGKFKSTDPATFLYFADHCRNGRFCALIPVKTLQGIAQLDIGHKGVV